MNKSILSGIGLLLLATAHVACGGSGQAGVPGQALDSSRDSSAADPGEEHGSGGKASGTSGSKGSGKAGSKSDGNGGSESDEPDSGSAGDTSSDGASGTPPPADSDGDGVADDRDWCPGTATGVAVTTAGCDLASEPSAQIPWGQPIPASAGHRPRGRATIRPASRAAVSPAARRFRRRRAIPLLRRSGFRW